MGRIKSLVSVVIDNRKEVFSMLSDLVKSGDKHIDEKGRFVFNEDTPSWVLIDKGDGEIEDTKITSFEWDKDRGTFKFYYEDEDGEEDYVENDECLNMSENNVYEVFADILEKD